MLEFLKRAAPWFFAILLVVAGYSVGYKQSDAKWQKEIHDEYVTKVSAAEQLQARLFEVGTRYQGDLARLEESTDRTLADLRKSNKRLLVKVKAAGTPTGDGRCEFNGRAELDDDSAKRIIRVTQKGDAWIKGLQDTIRALQGELKETKEK